MGLVADVQAYLEAQSLIGGATGWASIRRRIFDDVDQLVAISEDGGSPPEMQATAGIGDVALEDPAVQIYVRGEPWDGDSAETKAGQIFAALHGQTDIDLNGTTYVRVAARTSGPIFLGFDESGRPELTISFRARKLI